MRVRALELTDFRGYERLQLGLAAGMTVFVGENGTGKTNLLEAIHLVARGDSPRAREDPDLVRWGATVARVGATIERVEDERRLEVVLFAPLPGERRRPRRYLVEGAGKRAEDALGELLVVAFFPEDVELLTAAPSARRRYLDAMIGQVERSHRSATREYARVVEQRNALLRALRDGEAQDIELAFWDAELCRLAAAIASVRALATAELIAPFRAAAALFGEHDGLELTYLAQVPGESEADRELAYRHLLAEKRERERWQGTTLVGPHREDLAVTSRGRTLAAFASRGEQRSAVLALKIAEASWLRDRRGDIPVFLLDDVLSELDPHRRDALLDALPADAQVLVTVALLAGLPQRVVDGAALVAVPEGLRG